jgi:hypothetical protein
MTIFVKITDGFGNQMFQYAFACFLHKKYGEEVKLDASAFPYNSYRDLGLDNFTLLCPFATVEELPASPYLTWRNKLLKFFRPKLSKFRYYQLFSLFEYQIDRLMISRFIPTFIKQREI